MTEQAKPCCGEIDIASPYPLSRNGGNGRTVERYERFLQEAGYSVQVLLPGEEPLGDILIALHAGRSLEAVREYRLREAVGGCAVVLTGTDLYQDLPRGERGVLESLEKADLLVGLHRGVAADLPEEFRSKLRVIVQSAVAPPEKTRPVGAGLEDLVVLVPSHLREVKDPLLPARAVRGLPAESRIQVFLMGDALEENWGELALKEERYNPRFHWLRGRSHAEALSLIAGSDVVVIPSRSEGAANVLSEAIACGVPVLGSQIPGNVGILGDEPGPYFSVGDAEEMAIQLLHFERDERFRERLRDRVSALQETVSPGREKEALVSLVQELAGSLPQS